MTEVRRSRPPGAGASEQAKVPAIGAKPVCAGEQKKPLPPDPVCPLFARKVGRREISRMAYEGKLLDKCYDDMFDFSDAEVVVVSGDGPNRYGHMLLKAGSNYFQVVMGGFAGIHATPRYMDQDGYQRFLRESGKTQLFRYRVKIPEPQKSQLKLEQLLSQPRWWGGLTHNCEGLVEDIIVAGGGPKIHRG
jgi:hypothetical protein